MSWSIPHEPTRTARAAEVSQQGQCEVVRDALGSAPVLAVMGASGELSRVTMAAPTIDTEVEPSEVLLGQVIPSTLVHTATGTPTSVEVRNGADVILRGTAGVSGATVNFAGAIKALCAPSVGSGGMAVRAGSSLSPSAYDILIDEIALLPAESWTQINAGRNTFEDIWPPVDLRAEYGFGSGNPSAWHRIMGAWGGYGWDPVNHALWKIGGGHANSAANGVAGWRVQDRNWVLGFHDSRPLPVIVSNDRYRSIDFQSTPISVHTYGNNNYLPILQRFVSLGGAAHGDGGPWRVYDTGIPGNQSPIRIAACYTLDVSQAGLGMVAGETGSNEKRGAYAGIDLDGANAWELRDWWAKDPSARPTFFGVDFTARIDCGTAYREYNGHDALLYTSSSGTNKSVLLVEFVDHDGDNDLHYLVGGWDGDGEGQGQVAYADGPQIFLKSRNGGTAGNCYRFVDLKRTWGTENNWRSPTITGADLDEFLALTTTENPGLTDSGIHWNPIKGCFTIHFNRPQIWELYPPAGDPTPDAGWSLVKPAMAAAGPTGLPRSTQGTGTVESHAGVIGQVKWCPDLNCAIKIEGNTAGAVWLYKPTGWTDPR